MAFKDLDISEQLIWVYKRLTGLAGSFLRLSNSVAEMSIAGEVKAYAGVIIPSGWGACDGSLLLIEDYPQLFTALSNTYGGDGVTNFKLPDLQGRSLIGVGTGAGLTARALGDTPGTETHPLTTAELATHAHAATGGLVINAGLDTGKGILPLDTSDGNYLGNSSGTYRGILTITNRKLNTGSISGNTDNAGSGDAHNNMQPSFGINYIIALY